MPKEKLKAAAHGAPDLDAATRGAFQPSDRRTYEHAYSRSSRFWYADKNGRPSLTPGTYFRALLIGYFEGIDSERGIAWRAADSLGLRQFLQIGLDENTPDHSTISRTRRLIDIETHRKVFGWVLGVLSDRGLLKGKVVGVMDLSMMRSNSAGTSGFRRTGGEGARLRIQSKTTPWLRRDGEINYGIAGLQRIDFHANAFRSRSSSPIRLLSNGRPGTSVCEYLASQPNAGP